MGSRGAVSNALLRALRRSIVARVAPGSVAAAGSRLGEEERGARLKMWEVFGVLSGAVAIGSWIGQGKCSPAHCEESEEGKGKFLMKESYRRRVFFKYERRIRAFSPPEKVFEYFASLREDGQSFMTPSDLMRAVVPVFPSSESNATREGSLGGERSPGELSCPPSKFFMLFDTNGDGRISFPEFIFFVTLLSLPEENFKTTFKMFDIDGNDMIDREEFKKIMSIMRSQTRQGLAQRDGRRSIAVKTGGDSVEEGGLVQLFFGEDGKKLLNFEDFVSFLCDLHEEILKLEFSHYDFKQKGHISARDFALSLVSAANLSKINQYLDLADAIDDDPKFKSLRITYEEFRCFAQLRKKLPTLALAISSFGKTSGLLTKSDFQRAAAQVCSVPLTDAVIDVVFYIFDLNRDGNLSMEEFLGALQRREGDTGHPAEAGIVQVLKCWWNCARNCRNEKQWMSV
ncbi:calcium uptake protein, mitochondrial [Selaginella moellendorffii]|uniref:calcium uptake protein, mitochondrial n=1 Tax=Selaginella moellendorffii TaxID=88036 RepID=UPI000D1C40D6|nr:calcium uptake protein, mitochondrial [Selaginella moellendorffii]|eukprot:XP_024539270.1 calcium uptake protein, mitochondrial [Selaginella moellendorffii]